jgi:alpha-maltose-1-phosphate synthase
MENCGASSTPGCGGVDCPAWPTRSRHEPGKAAGVVLARSGITFGHPGATVASTVLMSSRQAKHQRFRQSHLEAGMTGERTDKRPRVIVIAEAANPEWVSVPLVGWSIASALRQRVNVHLVTQKRNSEAIMRAGWSPDHDFTAIDSEAVAARVWKLASWLRGSSGVAWTLATAMSVPSYYWFEYLFWKRFATELRGRTWDIVHRVTPLSPTTPSCLGPRLKALGIPFVLGPLNGGVPWPREFSQARRQEKEWLSYVRGAYRLLPGYRSMRDSAAAIIVGSRATWQQLGDRWGSKAIYIPENGVHAERFLGDGLRPTGGPLRVIFAGRLVPYKGADMLVEACARSIKAGKLRLEIVGDGPQRPALERAVAEQQLTAGVTFTGWVNHAGVAARLAQSHVLGFPSIREFGGGVVLEAMAAGAVPVVVNYAGPAEIVTPQTGCLIPLGPRETIITGLRTELERLAASPDEVAALAQRGRARIEQWFTWERKAGQIAAVYDWVLGRAGKPDFGMPFSGAAA